MRTAISGLDGIVRPKQEVLMLLGYATGLATKIACFNTRPAEGAVSIAGLLSACVTKKCSNQVNDLFESMQTHFKTDTLQPKEFKRWKLRKKRR